MKLPPALTLVELMLTMSLVTILSVTAIYSFSGSRQNQALKLSGDNLVLQLQRAHIFSRESKDEKTWGIVINGASQYSLVSKDSSGQTVEMNHLLNEPTYFTNGTGEIWFDQGTGNTENNWSTEIRSPRGGARTINVSQTGVVTMQ